MGAVTEPASASGRHLLSVAIPRPLEGLFTYELPAAMMEQAKVGAWVKVPFGRKAMHAFIVEPPKPFSSLPAGLDESKLKAVAEVGEVVLTPEVLKLCEWAHSFYGSPLGEVLHCAAPPAALGFKSKRSARKLNLDLTVIQRKELTAEQNVALGVLESHRLGTATDPKRVALLHGVTGSGKTEIYAELARRTLAEGKGVLLLVPEIALTSQLHRRFEEGLGVPVGLWHSAVADGKRRDLMSALLSGELRVIVGARSAVFAPIRNLGLIVIDEEHDSTYKQEDRVRYHARDLAVVRAAISKSTPGSGGAFVVLGSATPSLESRERVREGKYALAELPNRISRGDGVGGLPPIDLVDLTEEERVEDTQAVLAKRTVTAIQETIASGGQAMIFLNRRGFAAFLVCEDCGEVRGCPNCSISLTMHKRKRTLACHVCGHQERIPDVCEKCHGDKLKPMGAGTESLEDDLARLVPDAVMLRLDRDQVTSQTRLEQILDDFRDGKANILLGTQMLVKGHDFPGVTLVVVILADALFRWPDFRSTERAYQILKQVAGRAGRGERPGRVLIQTFDPQHAVLRALREELPEAEFIEGERELRKLLGYPPFGRMARIRFESAEAPEAKSRAEAAAGILAPLQVEGRIEVLGPSEAFLERAKGIYRWDILIKSVDIQGLQRAVFLTKDLALRQRWGVLVDVDPYSVG